MAQRGWSPEDADELRAAIGQFVRVGRSHDVLPRPQATVLGYLDREGPLTIAELAERSQVRHQTMRVTIGALQDAGAVSVTKSGTDGRKVFCALTAIGRDLLDRDRDTRTAWILRGIRQRLSLDQQATAHQIADILRLLAAEPDPGEAGVSRRALPGGRSLSRRARP
jgi:DNA-binding MarR family transcriptional regulator